MPEIRPTDDERFYTTRGFAERLNVSHRTAKEYVIKGLIPSYKIGGVRRINPADVESFLKKRRQEVA